MLVKTQYATKLGIAALVGHSAGASSGPFYQAVVALISAAFTPSPISKFSDFTEANFTGYARSAAITWTGPLNEADGSVSELSDLKIFEAGAAPVTANTIFGYALLDSATPPNLLGAEVFATPLAIVNPGDGFGLVAKINYGVNNPNEVATVVS